MIPNFIWDQPVTGPTMAERAQLPSEAEPAAQIPPVENSHVCTLSTVERPPVPEVWGGQAFGSEDLPKVRLCTTLTPGSGRGLLRFCSCPRLAFAADPASSPDRIDPALQSYLSGPSFWVCPSGVGFGTSGGIGEWRNAALVSSLQEASERNVWSLQGLWFLCSN